MLCLRDSEEAISDHRSVDGTKGSLPVCLPFHTATLRAGAAVFQIGDPRHCIYRIEAGTIEISETSPSGTRERIEEISSGAVFGLGFLEEHTTDAIALRESVVSCWPREALPFLEAQDPAVGQRHALETEREFLHRRRVLTDSAPKTPRGLLAGFLCVASRINESQGRDASLIDETVDCASVAAFLRMDIATLQQALVELRNRRLVAFEPPRGLRITDTDGLRLLANNERDDHPDVAIAEAVNA